MIKAVIFDCFGVVVGKGVWRIFELAGGDLKADHDGLEDIINKEALGQYNSKEFHRALAKLLGMSEEDWKKHYDKYDSIDIDLINYISELHKICKTAMLSNSSKGVVSSILSPAHQVVFDEIIVSGEVGLKKPDPRIFELTSKKLGIPPEECVFTDDHKEYLDGARALGMKTIHYKDLNQLKEELSLLLNA